MTEVGLEAGEITKPEQIDYIDGVLSTTFDECSIAAADAAKKAVERVAAQEVYQTIDVQPIGLYQSEALEPFNIHETIDAVQLKHPLISGNVSLALATHPHLDDLPLSLVAIFNHDMLLPLATFNPRQGGQCSYVQIGQEIDDDSLVVTPDAPRSDYVEAIRTLVAGGLKKPIVDRNPQAFDQKELIKKLIASEIETHRGLIEEALPAAAYRAAKACFERGNQTDLKLRKLIVLNDPLNDGEPRREIFTTRDLCFISSEDDDTATIDGRAVGLLLAARTTQQHTPKQTDVPKRRFFKHHQVVPEYEENTGDEQLHLLVVLRSGVAIDLLQISPKTVLKDGLQDGLDIEEITKLMSSVDPKQIEKREHIALFKQAYVAFKILSRGKSFEKEPAHVILSEAHRMCSVNIKPGENRRPYPSNITVLPGSYVIGGSWPEFRQQLREIPRLYEHRFTESALRSRADAVIQELTESLMLAQQIEQHLGPGRSASEDLVIKLGNIVANGQLSLDGVLPSRKVGKTTTDVSASVEITQDSNKLHVVVSGRPAAMDEFDATTIFDEIIYTDRRNVVSDDKLKGISAVLGILCDQKAGKTV